MLRFFGNEAWEPRRVKPVGFTISGPPDPRNSRIRVRRNPPYFLPDLLFAVPRVAVLRFAVPVFAVLRFAVPVFAVLLLAAGFLAALLRAAGFLAVVFFAVVFFAAPVLLAALVFLAAVVFFAPLALFAAGCFAMLASSSLRDVFALEPNRA